MNWASLNFGSVKVSITKVIAKQIRWLSIRIRHSCSSSPNWLRRYSSYYGRSKIKCRSCTFIITLAPQYWHGVLLNMQQVSTSIYYDGAQFTSVSFQMFLCSSLAGGMVLFSVVINSFVHVIMYSYYFAALFGPAVQRKLEGIKRNITLIQMVTDFSWPRTDNTSWTFLSSFTLFQIQFTIILIQCALSLAQGCDIPKLLFAIYVPNVLLIFFMFYDFFKKAYKQKADLPKVS